MKYWSTEFAALFDKISETQHKRTIEYVKSWCYLIKFHYFKVTYINLLIAASWRQWGNAGRAQFSWLVTIIDEEHIDIASQSKQQVPN